MSGCPGNIERKLAIGESTQIVYWKEPDFFDNVGVVNVYKTRVSYIFMRLWLCALTLEMQNFIYLKKKNIFNHKNK